MRSSLCSLMVFRCHLARKSYVEVPSPPASLQFLRWKFSVRHPSRFLRFQVASPQPQRRNPTGSTLFYRRASAYSATGYSRIRLTGAPPGAVPRFVSPLLPSERWLFSGKKRLEGRASGEQQLWNRRKPAMSCDEHWWNTRSVAEQLGG